MKKDIYYLTVAKKKVDCDEGFSISTEKCQEICEKLGLDGITFLKIGTGDNLIDFDKIFDERIHYEVKKNEL